MINVRKSGFQWPPLEPRPADVDGAVCKCDLQCRAHFATGETKRRHRLKNNVKQGYLKCSGARVFEDATLPVTWIDVVNFGLE